ncbi:SR140 [Lepeophtheirus salmonis]|uniref:SR140 n=1 Tax=Lepeophtheirus salmonis TaxID=72036 RepID=A0A7R8D1I1_LEPSM|nr:SR140 [Lepeophtheirus salmonis]CAF2995698.1 SR140 [Lepeophtheirus salmonis]
MISEKKLKAFVLGGVGRRGSTKKDVEEAKQKEEKEAVGKAYQEFVDTSGKGSLYRPKSKLSSMDKEMSHGSVESSKSTSSGASASSGGGSGSGGGSSSSSSTYRRPEKPGSKKKIQEKKKSNLESFKEELKAIQEGKRRASSSPPGPTIVEPVPVPVPSPPLCSGKDQRNALDCGDPTSTNLYLGNLSPRLTEQQLMEIFGKYGPLASIKIMWPRTEDEKSRGRNCGFVAYMSRVDGERALNNLSGKDVDGFEMKMGWGKPVPIPLFPLYIPPKLLKLTLPPPTTGLPFNCQCSEEQLNKSHNYNPPKNASDQEKFDKLLFRSTVKVVIPTDRTKLCLINRMIEFVIREGPMFEAMIMNREMNNPNFRFLFENKSHDHIYYRWRLYSIMQGDSKENWSTDDFRMFKGGSIWKPPPLNLFAAGVPEELLDDDVIIPQRRNNKTSDPPNPKKEDSEEYQEELAQIVFEEMLRNLVPDRNPIAESMVWCIEHADAGEEIVDCIYESLSIPETPLAKKIARLYLISDILHNCSVKGITNVSYFRKGFQVKLPEVFDHLYECHKSIESRIKAESFKQRIMLCFRAWEDWALYPQDFLINLQNKFLGLMGDQYMVNDVTPTQIDEGSDEEDVDGIPLDGAALLKSAAKTESDKVKLPITKDSDDSDLDGAPLDDPSSLNPSSNRGVSGFLPSKWETVDPEDVQAQAVTEEDDDDIDGIPMQLDDDEIDMRVSESRRSKLRDIEIKDGQYQNRSSIFAKKLMRKEFRSVEDDERHSRSRKRKKTQKEKVVVVQVHRDQDPGREAVEEEDAVVRRIVVLQEAALIDR